MCGGLLIQVFVSTRKLYQSVIQVFTRQVTSIMISIRNHMLSVQSHKLAQRPDSTFASSRLMVLTCKIISEMC